MFSWVEISVLHQVQFYVQLLLDIKLEMKEKQDDNVGKTLIWIQPMNMETLSDVPLRLTAVNNIT